MTTRQALHELVDRIPEGEVEAAELALAGFAADRAASSLRERLDRVPVVREPLSAEDVAAIERGLESMRQGKGVSDEELDRLLASL